MGIIISSFTGCGKTYLTNATVGRIKILDATNINGDGMVDEIMGQVDKYDIVFIGCDKDTREAFDDRKIDYDLFYPSVERRNEFIENQVKKRTKPDKIRELDNDFIKMVQELDDIDVDNCYKHKLNNGGEFIGNNEAIARYINSIIGNRNEQG